MGNDRVYVLPAGWRTLAVMGLYAQVATREGLTLLDERTVPLAAASLLTEVTEYPPQLAWLAAMPSDSPPADIREALFGLLDRVGLRLPERETAALATKLTGYWLQCIEEQAGSPVDLMYLITIYGASDWLLSKPRMARLSRSQVADDFPPRLLRRAWLELMQFVHTAEHSQREVDRTTAARLAARVLDCAQAQGVVGLNRDSGQVIFVPPRAGWM